MRLNAGSTQQTEFITANTSVRAPSLVPEFNLHLAGEITPLWERACSVFGPEAPLPFWAVAWPGGQALARYVLDHPELVHGAKVLVFAAGAGLEALAAKRACAFTVEACDTDPLAITALNMNASRNAECIRAFTDNVIGVLDGDWDVVLAGDIFYEQSLVDKALPWLKTMADRGVAVFLADAGRTYRPALADLEFLARYNVPVDFEVESKDEIEAAVYRLKAEASPWIKERTKSGSF